MQVDYPLSDAISIYFSDGVHSYPLIDKESVRALENGDELLLRVEEIVREMGQIPPNWERYSFSEACDQVTNKIKERHPELAQNAIKTLHWQYSYSSR